jgi:hypothetical protein
VEGGDERRALQTLPGEQALDPLAHLARGLVREGDGEDVVGRNVALADQISDAVDDDARLARPRAGQNQQRPLGRHDRLALPLVE